MCHTKTDEFTDLSSHFATLTTCTMYSQCTYMNNHWKRIVGRKLREETTKGSLWNNKRRLLSPEVCGPPGVSIRHFHSNISALRSPRTKHIFTDTSALSTLSVDQDDEDIDRLCSSLQSDLLSHIDLDKTTDYIEWQPNERTGISCPIWDLDKPLEDIVEEGFMEDMVTNPRKDCLSPRDILLGDFDHREAPDPSNLEATQIWLECLSQQEHVVQLQETLNSARERKDFASMTIVQNQVLQWYQELKDEIERVQKIVILRINDDEFGKCMAEGAHLCVLQPQKLAVIAAHEAIVACLLEQDKCSTLTICSRIGGAVESETNVQLVLYQMAEKERRKKAGIGDHNDDEWPLRDEDSLDEFATLKISKSEKSEVTNPLFTINDWTYSATHLQRFLQDGNFSKLSASHQRSVQKIHKKARRLLNNKEPWTTKEKVQLGAVLMKILMKVATVDFNGTTEPAFFHDILKYDSLKQKGIIRVNEGFMKAALQDEYKSLSAFSTRFKPMVIPPIKWTGPQSGGYRWLKADLMRTHGSKGQSEALKNQDLSMIYDGLNVLGQVPWKINCAVLDVAQRCWRENIALGDIPTQTDVILPPEPIRPEYVPKSEQVEGDSDVYRAQFEQYLAYQRAHEKYNRARQRNMDLHSSRCSALLKLDQAEQFKDFGEIFFPYNLDFRGRAYPVPPHLSTVGSDLCRGLLSFAKKKPLGKRGFYWLKVHLANLGGNDKVSFDDRAKHTEGNMERIRAAVDDPFGEDRWWMSLDDPYQGMATCHEIINAIDSGDPESFMSSIPIHMDGSCNGLQHYAALGRDSLGGAAVNLIAADKPQDVYSGVMQEVIRLVAVEAALDLDFGDEPVNTLSKEKVDSLKKNRAAKLVNGLIDRGVVKRTVMTSVYGVTYIGARAQIQEKIVEKLEARGDDVHEIMPEIQYACGYLASMTMDVMGQLFVGARQTMNWLTCCARLISSQGSPVSWISPIGVPVVQPYRQDARYNLRTLVQNVTLMSDAEGLPLHLPRQASAFPPNFVHSLDSSHMILTALEMDRRGLSFCAVHDSFWTHACDVDELNTALRDSFIELYEQPLLEGLKKTWEIRYPSIVFPDLPERGSLDLRRVKDSPYFFQ